MDSQLHKEAVQCGFVLRALRKASFVNLKPPAVKGARPPVSAGGPLSHDLSGHKLQKVGDPVGVGVKADYC
jgi:hypothetical protein